MQKTQRMKIFTDRAYLLDGIDHCSMLKPHWGNDDTHEAYQRYARIGSEFQELTGPAEADFALLPFDATHILSRDKVVASKAKAMALRFASLARAEGLRVVALATDEAIDSIGLDGAITLRNALDRKKSQPGDFAMPGWFDDYVNAYLGGSIIIRDKVETPLVGFCGMAALKGPTLRRRVKILGQRALKPLGVRYTHNDGLFIRKRAMDALATHPGLKTDFIVRSQFFGGVSEDPSIREKVRREFYDNLVGCDYVLCVRGFSNFSFRFYEAMSVGRIPVLIDTDTVLPYDFLHDYRDLCVIVPEAEIDQAGDHVLRFHERLSPEEFREIQLKIRQFWEDWLSPEGYFRNVPLHLEQMDRSGTGVQRRPLRRGANA